MFTREQKDQMLELEERLGVGGEAVVVERGGGRGKGRREKKGKNQV